jgi:hypothetical protein
LNVRNFDLVKGMKTRTKSISALLLATITMASAAVIPATTYNDTVKTNFSHPISNVAGKSLVAQEVSYPPGGASAPHRHSNSAFITLSKGVPHAWCNLSHSPLRMVVIALPGGCEEILIVPQRLEVIS